MRVDLDLGSFPRGVEFGTTHKRCGHLYRIRIFHRMPEWRRFLGHDSGQARVNICDIVGRERKTRWV